MEAKRGTEALAVLSCGRRARLSSLLAALLFLLTITTVCNAANRGPIVWDGNGWLPLPAGDVGPDPYPPKSDSWKSPNTTIFIGVSAFRDARCPKTLFNYFTKAKYPDRVFVGIVQQNNDKEDPDCVAEYCKLMGAPGEGPNCPYFNNIRPVRIDYRLAAGPCFGRHLQYYVLRDEQFCMQTDSHMDTLKHWDTELMNMWGRANNEYGVLTTYVHRIEQLNDAALESKQEVPHLCQVSFPSGNPRYVQAKLAMRLPKPKLTNAWAAGFSFARCHAWRATPYDPHLRMVFDGEEFSMAARLWTRGYDMYTPDKSVVGHDYNPVEKGPQPGSWVQNRDQSRREAAHVRLRSVLHMKGGDEGEEMQKSIGRYGLGKKRSMDQYQRFVGANLTTLEITSNRCGAIEWVPFKEEWPPNENNLGGPYWERRLAGARAAQAKAEQLAAQKKSNRGTEKDLAFAAPGQVADSEGLFDAFGPGLERVAAGNGGAAAAEEEQRAPDMDLLFGHGGGIVGVQRRKTVSSAGRSGGGGKLAVLAVLAAAGVALYLHRRNKLLPLWHNLGLRGNGKKDGVSNGWAGNGTARSPRRDEVV